MAVLLWAGAAFAQQQLPLSRTHPEHYKEQPGAELPPPDPSMLPPPRLEQRLVYRFPGPIGEYADPDRDLSALCRRGAFRQQVDGFFHAATPERSYGVAFAAGGNLYDLTGAKGKSLVYFFDDQNTGRCQVWRATLDQVTKYAQFK
ncbi:MAG TPA: hypothetical protein VEB64_11685 [Azospirillaceae bacterium]|nr:hypothetical protein [Azospirillaceae bacterium]